MNGKKALYVWIVVFIASFVLDSIAHIGLTGDYVMKELAGALKAVEDVNFLPLMAEYIIITTGIVYLLKETDAMKKPVSYAAQIGALIGLMVYGIYGLINVSLLIKWSWNVVVIDTIIGVAVMAISAVAARVAYGFFSKGGSKK